MTKDEFYASLVYKEVAISKKGKQLLEEYNDAPVSQKGFVARMKVENDIFSQMLEEIRKQYNSIGEDEED